MNKRRVKVTTTANLELKNIWECNQTLHKKGINDALDRGMIEFLKELCNIDIIEYELRETDKRKERLLIMKEKAKDNERILKEQNKEKLSEEDELELERSKALKTLLKKPYNLWTAPNRHHARDVGKFKNTGELKKWVQEKQRGN